MEEWRAVNFIRGMLSQSSIGNPRIAPRTNETARTATWCPACQPAHGASDLAARRRGQEYLAAQRVGAVGGAALAARPVRLQVDILEGREGEVHGAVDRLRDRRVDVALH